MNKTLQMFFIIIAGETIFMLPFLIPRLYRPLMLEGWALTNTDIGVAFAAYGITSTISYLFGGPFADKFNPRVLISFSLAITSLSSLYMVIHPSPTSFVITYAFFGMSTVLLMWGALIKTTHVISGEDNRSTALGILDGGRGLVAALAGTALILIISANFSDLKDHDEQIRALRIIYFSIAGFTLFVAIAVWISLKNLDIVKSNETSWDLQRAVGSLKNTKVWLLGAIILSSYCGYKGIDNYSIYLVDIHRLEVSHASALTSIVVWLRPFSALLTGILADVFHRKMGSGRFIVLALLLSLCGSSQTLLAFVGFSNLYFAFSIMIVSVTFVYGLRAVYFSVFGDLKIKTYLLGTTIGIASFVGFLPDIFLGYISGRLIDGYPGELGYRYAFLFTAACLFAGALASFILYRKALKGTADGDY